MCGSSNEDSGNDSPRPMSHGPSTSQSFPSAVTSSRDGSVVRDAHGRPVTSTPVTRERQEREIHREPSESAPSQATTNQDNLTAEEQEEEGVTRKGRKTPADKRQTRLTILRTNPVVSTGTKNHRAVGLSGVTISN